MCITIHLSLWLNILLHKHTMKFSKASREQQCFRTIPRALMALGDM